MGCELFILICECLGVISVVIIAMSYLVNWFASSDERKRKNHLAECKKITSTVLLDIDGLKINDTHCWLWSQFLVTHSEVSDSIIVKVIENRNSKLLKVIYGA